MAVWDSPLTEARLALTDPVTIDQLPGPRGVPLLGNLLDLEDIWGAN